MNEKLLSRLKLYLYVFGFMNIVVLPFVVPFFLGNYLFWSPRNYPVEMMVSSLYFGMGLIMIVIARNPKPHQAFVDFLIISNILHALVMLFTAQNMRHIFIDVSVVVAIGIIPLILYPWRVNNFMNYKKIYYKSKLID